MTDISNLTDDQLTIRRDALELAIKETNKLYTDLSDKANAEIRAEQERVRQEISLKYGDKLMEYSGALLTLKRDLRPIENELASRATHELEGQLYISWEGRCPHYTYRTHTYPIWYKIQTMRSDTEIYGLDYGRGNRMPKPGQTILRRVNAKGKPLKGFMHLNWKGEVNHQIMRPVAEIRPLPKGVDITIGSYPDASEVWAAFIEHGVMTAEEAADA